MTILRLKEVKKKILRVTKQIKDRVGIQRQVHLTPKLLSELLCNLVYLGFINKKYVKIEKFRRKRNNVLIQVWKNHEV